jgi:hypothetical protein
MELVHFPHASGNLSYRHFASGVDTLIKVISMSYRQEPLPKGLPNFAIPGGPIAGYASKARHPSLESTFKFVCRFWCIAFEMTMITT